MKINPTHVATHARGYLCANRSRPVKKSHRLNQSRRTARKIDVTDPLLWYTARCARLTRGAMSTKQQREDNPRALTPGCVSSFMQSAFADGTGCGHFPGCVH